MVVYLHIQQYFTHTMVVSFMGRWNMWTPLTCHAGNWHTLTLTVVSTTPQQCARIKLTTIVVIGTDSYVNYQGHNNTNINKKTTFTDLLQFRTPDTMDWFLVISFVSIWIYSSGNHQQTLCVRIQLIEMTIETPSLGYVSGNLNTWGG